MNRSRPIRFLGALALLAVALGGPTVGAALCRDSALAKFHRGVKPLLQFRPLPSETSGPELGIWSAAFCAQGVFGLGVTCWFDARLPTSSSEENRSGSTLNEAVPATPFAETEVWRKGEGGYASHFVYGITVTQNDTILVACEGRVAGADAGEKDLLLKRSTDHGATWSSDVTIEGKADTNSWSNPTFVTDGATTYLFYSWTVTSDIGRVFYRTSTDNGLTWSDRTEITSLWEHNPHGWTQHSSIGHGIVKTKPPEAGRVFVAFHHRGEVALPPARRGYGNDIICLGPNGWEIAGGPPINPTRGTNEARLAERDDGSLYLIARQATGNNQLRARSESRDGGRTWTAWTSEPDLRGTVCDGGLLHYAPGLDFYTFPSSTDRSAQHRRDLMVKYSTDGGVTWKGGRLIHRGQSTYSDLARDSLGNVYCVYGRDGTDFMGDRVFVARFTPAWATATR